MNTHEMTQVKATPVRRPIDDPGAGSQVDRLIFEVLSARAFDIASLQGGDLSVLARRLDLTSESEVVASNIAALVASLQLLREDFEQRIVIRRPHGEPAEKQGRVGFRVSLNGSTADVQRCRSFYEVELRDRWADVVKTAKRIGHAHTPLTQFSLGLDDNDVDPTPPPAQTAPSRECAVSKGEEARQKLATELVARLAGKSYDFLLGTADRTKDAVPLSGSLDPQQSRPEDPVGRTLVGRIVTIGRNPGMLKLRAYDIQIDRKERPWIVSFVSSEQLVAALAPLFALPLTAAPIRFEVDCFREAVIGGSSERFELRSFSQETEPREAANESAHSEPAPPAAEAQIG